MAADQTPADLARFHECLPDTLAQERLKPNAPWGDPKNFSNSAHDRGGATQDGIIQREYDSYRRRQGEPVQSVKLISQAEGEDIYDREYWLPYCPLLPLGLDLQFFDTSVNEGTHEAIKILQFVLGITSDGQWGPQTQSAVEIIPVSGDSLISIITKFTARRAAVYRMMPDDKYFDEDWERRTQEIGAAALKMAEAA